MLGRIVRFIKYNEHKSITIQAFFCSAFYRFQLLYCEKSKLRKKWGVEGEESPKSATLEEYRYAKKVSYAVNRVCNKTRWESKCLVRALTAQYLLWKKGIQTTMYLGCALNEKDKMIAHAWLRCGNMYVTGGNGSEYVIVDKFKK